MTIVILMIKRCQGSDRKWSQEFIFKGTQLVKGTYLMKGWFMWDWVGIDHRRVQRDKDHRLP